MAKRSRLIKLETYQHRQSGIQARSLNQRVLDKWLHDPQKDIVITVGPASKINPFLLNTLALPPKSECFSIKVTL